MLVASGRPGRPQDDRRAGHLFDDAGPVAPRGRPLGFTDMPSDQPWQTALHQAAEDGDLELAMTLLRLGADPHLRDHRFNGTPLSWARYFGHQELVDLLQPLTEPDS
jgi:Ankyrin repeats (3 copies)